MKKAILVAVCFMMASAALVNDTLAMDLSKAVNEVFANLSEWLENGMPEIGGEKVDVALVSSDSHQMLYPGGAATRTSAVKNQGSESVYFRLAYAVQYDSETWDKLQISFDADADSFRQTDWKEIDINGTPYRMKVFTYTKALEPNAQAPDVTVRIAMDASITSRQLGRYQSEFLKIQALAIETKAFAEATDNAQEALEMALPLDTMNPF
ncbi:MAG: hypothetical protein E7329_11880 [Clostridiales bacterium]|nr:hypothetical protein [Clostridiales bacterium]